MHRDYWMTGLGLINSNKHKITEKEKIMGVGPLEYE
jgi:hypothetical protein